MSTKNRQPKTVRSKPNKNNTKDVQQQRVCIAQQLRTCYSHTHTHRATSASIVSGQSHAYDVHVQRSSPIHCIFSEARNSRLKQLSDAIPYGPITTPVASNDISLFRTSSENNKPLPAARAFVRVRHRPVVFHVSARKPIITRR